jgi:hypothetical protein
MYIKAPACTSCTPSSVDEWKKRRERKDKEKFVVMVSGLQAWSEATTKKETKRQGDSLAGGRTKQKIEHDENPVPLKVPSDISRMASVRSRRLLLWARVRHGERGLLELMAGPGD